jgi:hypothetical protein
MTTAPASARTPEQPTARTPTPWAGRPVRPATSARLPRVAPPLATAAVDLLADARRALHAAAAAALPAERYATAHRAALRATAAVLAVRTRPTNRRRGPQAAWSLLVEVAPELSEWAAFFAANAGKRAAAEAGLLRAVTAREADDLLREAETFLALVETTLGMPAQPPLPRLAVALTDAGAPAESAALSCSPPLARRHAS